MKKILAITVLAASLWAVKPAFASEWISEEPNHHLNQLETEVHAVFAYDNAVGAGVRFNIPIVQQGFIHTINNNVALSFGADIMNWPASDFEVSGIVIPVALQWNFYLSRDWSVFGEAGVAFQNWFEQKANGDEQTLFVYPGIGVGTRYYFNPGNYPALIVRLGFPEVLSVGVSF